MFENQGIFFYLSTDITSRKVLEDYINIGRKPFNLKNSMIGKWVYNPLFSDKLRKIKNCSKGGNKFERKTLSTIDLNACQSTRMGVKDE